MMLAGLKRLEAGNYGMPNRRHPGRWADDAPPDPDTEGTDTSQPTRPGTPSVAVAVGSALRGQRVPLVVRWSGASDGGAGLASPAYEVQRYTPDALGPWGPAARTSRHDALVRAYAGTHWLFRVVARDAVGHAATSRPSPMRQYDLVQETSRSVIVTHGWHWVRRDVYSGGATRYSTRTGAAGWSTLTGRGIALVSTTGPTRGRVRVYVDGRARATVDLWRPATTYRTVVWAASWATRSRHTIRLVVVATPGRPRVDLDALVVTR